MSEIITYKADLFDSLKTKVKNNIRYKQYYDLLFNTLLEMFEYEGLPNTIPVRFLETYLHLNGDVFIGKINGELYALKGSLAGEVDAYGVGTEVVAVCPIGEVSGKRDIDVAWGINNDTATPDILTYWTSHLMAENDKSIDLNILYARLLNIPKLNDEKDKQAFTDIINNLIDGELMAFVSKNVLADELGDTGANVFQITDVNKIDRLQYLSRFADDILKRFYNFYGQSVQTQNKSAQSISDELHGMDSVSFIIPIQMLKCRQKMCENINRIFGTNISVKFSLPWGLEYNALVLRDTNENGKPDINEPINDSTHKGADLETTLNPTEPTEPITPELEPISPDDTDSADLGMADMTDTEKELEVLKKIIEVYEDLTEITKEDIITEINDKGGE